MRKAKRVKFVDTDIDHASWRRQEAIVSPKSDSPKTSEYAYFRSLKNSNVRGHSRSLRKESEQSKSSIVNHLTRDTSNVTGMLKPSTKNLEFSVSGEMTGPSNSHFFLSPRVSKHDEPDQIRSEDPVKNSKQRSSLVSENFTPIGQHLSSSPLNEASEIAGNQCSEENIFSAKRQRLRQWVARTSFSEVQKLHPKGFDLVASLLGRLSPKGDECYNSSTGNADKSKLSPLYESKNPEKGPQLTHTRKWDEDLQKNCSGSLSEIVPSEWDTFVPRFHLPNYCTDTHFQDELMDFDQCSKNRKGRSSHTQHVSSFCLPTERCGSSNFSHLKELHKYHSLFEHPKEELHRFFLEWDNERGKDGVNEFCSPFEYTRKYPHRLLLELDHERFCFPFEHPRNDPHRLLREISHERSKDGVNEFFSPFEHPKELHRPLLGRDHERSKYGVSEFCSPFEHPRKDPHRLLLEWDHVQSKDGVNEFCSPFEHPKEELHRPLLEWDHEPGKNGIDLSISNHDTARDICPRLATSWHVNHQEIMNKEFDTKALCSPSLPSNHYLEFDSIPNPLSTSCLVEELGPNLESVKCAVAESDQFSLASPCTSKLITLEDDRNAENILYSSKTMCSYRDQFWPKNEVWDGKARNDIWGKCLYATDLSAEAPPSLYQTSQFPENVTSLYCSPRLEEAHGEPFTRFSEGAFNNHLWSSNFRLYLDRLINCPSLLDNVGKYRSDKNIYFDDDVELGYR